MKEFVKKKKYNQGWGDVTWAAPISVVVPGQPADALVHTKATPLRHLWACGSTRLRRKICHVTPMQ